MKNHRLEILGEETERVIGATLTEVAKRAIEPCLDPFTKRLDKATKALEEQASLAADEAKTRSIGLAGQMGRLENHVKQVEGLVATAGQRIDALHTQLRDNVQQVSEALFGTQSDLERRMEHLAHGVEQHHNELARMLQLAQGWTERMAILESGLSQTVATQLDSAKGAHQLILKGFESRMAEALQKVPVEVSSHVEERHARTEATLALRLDDDKRALTLQVDSLSRQVQLVSRRMTIALALSSGSIILLTGLLAFIAWRFVVAQ